MSEPVAESDHYVLSTGRRVSRKALLNECFCLKCKPDYSWDESVEASALIQRVDHNSFWWADRIDAPDDT